MLEAAGHVNVAEKDLKPFLSVEEVVQNVLQVAEGGKNCCICKGIGGAI